MNAEKVYILDDRAILFINGADSEKYLQNLVSNDIEKVNESKSCFASLLSPQGKFLFDFLVIKHKNGYFLDCEKRIVDQLYKKLVMYKLRSKVEILNLTNEFVVAAFSHDKFLSIDGAKDDLGYTFKYNEDHVLLDPRNKKLGGRIIANLEKLYMSLKKMKLKSSDIEEYYKLSFELGIPQSNTDQLQEKLFGIECNFVELNAIDFKKGCYVGQENTSRIKNKDKLNKRLLPIQVKKGSINSSDPITSNNVEIGKVLIASKFNFALIKFRDKEFEFNKEFKCGEANIEILKPNWLN
ncbi:folate-binding protein [Candidatus Pelagibacter sp.]|nr:folate-binding protein [Candidatus Pelagibacter sp.]